MRPDELRTLLREEADRARPSDDALEEIYERIERRRPTRRHARAVGLVAASVVLLAAIVGAVTLMDTGRTPVEIEPVGDSPPIATGQASTAPNDGEYDPTEDLEGMGIAAHPDYQHLIEAEPELCDWVADVADQADGPRARRSAVNDAIAREIDDASGVDGVYAAVAWSCIARRCPATPDDAVSAFGYGQDGRHDDWQNPSAHADLGPDAPWPCATDDYV